MKITNELKKSMKKDIAFIEGVLKKRIRKIPVKKNELLKNFNKNIIEEEDWRDNPGKPLNRAELWYVRKLISQLKLEVKIKNKPLWGLCRPPYHNKEYDGYIFHIWYTSGTNADIFTFKAIASIFVENTIKTLISNGLYVELQMESFCSYDSCTITAL